VCGIVVCIADNVVGSIDGVFVPTATSTTITTAATATTTTTTTTISR
jgi:hypothetical protein